jgi:ketosteroid isomerase-like protein
LATAAALAASSACSNLATDDAAVYRRAESQRVEYLEREVERMREDLSQAENAMIYLESGMRGEHTRADAVSAVAGARVEVESACERAPWRSADCEEARSKLLEAEQQIQRSRMGAAVFFASRAQRIAEDVGSEAQVVARMGDALFVTGRRVNLRSGPSTDATILRVLTRSTPVFQERRDGEWVLVRTHSGRVGWIYGSLLDAR